jgi:hypothetical protein
MKVAVENKAAQDAETNVKTPYATFSLPVIGMGLGLFIAHSKRAAGSSSNSVAAYIFTSLIFGALFSIPAIIWVKNRSCAEEKERLIKSGIDNPPDVDIDTVWEKVNGISEVQKTGQNFNQDDKKEFAKSFSTLTPSEKLAFVEIVDVVKESTKFKRKSEKLEFASTEIKKIGRKYGKDKLQTLFTKLGKFTLL